MGPQKIFIDILIKIFVTYQTQICEKWTVSTQFGAFPSRYGDVLPQKYAQITGVNVGYLWSVPYICMYIYLYIYICIYIYYLGHCIQNTTQ